MRRLLLLGIVLVAVTAVGCGAAARRSAHARFAARPAPSLQAAVNRTARSLVLARPRPARAPAITLAPQSPTCYIAGACSLRPCIQFAASGAARSAATAAVVTIIAPATPARRPIARRPPARHSAARRATAPRPAGTCRRAAVRPQTVPVALR